MYELYKKAKGLIFGGAKKVSIEYQQEDDPIFNGDSGYATAPSGGSTPPKQGFGAPLASSTPNFPPNKATFPLVLRYDHQGHPFFFCMKCKESVPYDGWAAHGCFAAHAAKITK